MGASTFKRMRQRNKARIKAGKGLVYMKPQPDVEPVEKKPEKSFEELVEEYTEEEIEVPEFRAMTKGQILKWAKNNNVNAAVDGTMKKGDIIVALEEELFA